MKLRNKLLAALCLALIACMAVPAVLPGDFGGVVTAQTAKAKLSKNKATVLNGKTLKLKLKNNRKKVTWSSSDESVATVSQKGVVKARKVGKTTITAQVGQKAYACVVTVKSPLKASDTQLNLKAGASRKVTITWELSGKVSLENDNAGAVKCSLGKFKKKKAKLTIKALEPGNATITIRNAKTDDVVTIAVTVTGAAGTGQGAGSSGAAGTTAPIADKTSLTIAKGKTAQLKVTWPYEEFPYVWYNNALVKTTWGEWNGKGWPLSVKGLKAGKTEIQISKGEKGPVLVTIPVTVK